MDPSDETPPPPSEHATDSVPGVAPSSERATESLPSDDAAPQPKVREGDVLLGKYRVEGVLGAGGMGVVVAATHLQLRTRVALKLMRSAKDRRGPAVARFLREARAAARIKGEHVARVMDVGTLEDGTPFMAMEHLAGRDLGAELKARGKLTVEEAVEYVLQACEAVAEAHAAGVVHRDLKPSNLFLARRADGSPLVKVLDFGIAKAKEDERAASLDALTASNAVLGSPVYMSPEQIRSASDVDHRTDVWSLGVILYELVSGALPFAGASTAARLAAIAADPPVPLDRVRPDLPAGLPAVVERCLEKDVGRRTPDVAALARDLARFAPSRALGSVARVEAALGVAPERAAAAPGRLARGVFALAAAALAAGAALGARSVARRTASEAAPRAAAPALPRPFAPVNVRRVTFDEGVEEFPSWTPDGRAIAYDARSGADHHVFLLDLATGVRRAITSEPGDQMGASISPRGGELAYLLIDKSGQGTYAVALDGTGRRRLSDIGVVRPSWSPDGAFVWVGSGNAPQRIDARTLAPSRTLRPPEDGIVLRLIELRDGRVVAHAVAQAASGALDGLILFAAGKDRGEWLWRESLDEVLELAPDGESVLASTSAAGAAVQLWRVPLDGSPPEPVARRDVLPTKGLRLSPDGRRVAWSNGRDVQDLAYLTSGRAPGTLVARAQGGSSDWRDEEMSAIPGTTSVVVMSTRMGPLRPCVVDTTAREAPRCLDLGGLTPSSASPSADGRWLTFAVAAQGVFVMPLDGSAPARRLTEVRGKEAHVRPVFSPDGKEVYFTVKAGSSAHVEAVEAAGGPPRRVLEDGTRAISFSPRGDAAAFLVDTEGVRGTPMLMDLATRKRRPLSPHLADRVLNRRVGVFWSASGKRAAVVRGEGELIELDVTAGAVSRRLDSPDQILGAAYVGEEIVITRVSWTGDIWVADL